MDHDHLLIERSKQIARHQQSNPHLMTSISSTQGYHCLKLLVLHRRPHVVRNAPTLTMLYSRNDKNVNLIDGHISQRHVAPSPEVFWGLSHSRGMRGRAIPPGTVRETAHKVTTPATHILRLKFSGQDA